MKKIISLLAVIALAVLGLAGPAAANQTPAHDVAHHVPLIPANQPKVQPRTICATQCFTYAGKYQTPSPAPTDALLSIDVKKPSLNGDFHTLGEIAVQSLDQKQTVEVGWTVSSANPNSDPYLFVSSWKNGTWDGYNNVNFTVCTLALCGATPAAVPGSDINSYVGAASPPVFGISYFGSAYWVKFAGTWIGFFNASHWTGVSPAFTNIPLFQAFGEIASANTVACAQMGDGVKGSVITGAARMGNLTYAGTTATASFTGNTVTDPTYYDDAFLTMTTTRSFAYGGLRPAGTSPC